MRNACQLPNGGSAPATPGFNATAPEWLAFHGAADAAPAIPAAESTLGSHPCVALSSAQVLPEWINRNPAVDAFASGGTNPLNFVSQPWGSLQLGLEYTPSLDLLVRTKIRPENLVSLIRGEIRDLNRDIPITCHTIEDELAVLTLQPRFNAVLLGIFSGIALLLATVGIYGVLYSSMADRIAPRIRRTVDQPDS